MPRRPSAALRARQPKRQQRLRQRAVDAVRLARQARNAGRRYDRVETIARRFGITRQTLHAWVRAAECGGGAAPAPRRAGRPRRWGGKRDVIIRDLHRHLLTRPAEERTATALVGWFRERTGVTYAETTLRRLLWRLGCCYATASMTGGVWSGQRRLAALPPIQPAASPPSAPAHTSIPAWLTDARQHLIRALVRRAEALPRETGMTTRTLLEKLPGMALAMKASGATEEDLRGLLLHIGIAVDSVSERLRRSPALDDD